MNPYSKLEDYAFWSRSMSRPAPSQIDPCVSGRIISPTDKVVTIGSCFAQHLGRFIRTSGLNYYVPEAGPDDMPETEKAIRNYGTFSGRYGNVYTVRQLNQMFDRAFGLFSPEDDRWEHKGCLVDAFRPQIQPEGFGSESELEADRASHLAYVRNIFTEADFLIFTLGLTEGWRSKKDGAIYPVAPGVSGGTFDPVKYEFVNFTAAECEADLAMFLEKLRGVNPRAEVILTVSPVPLIATYEPRHVWVSTTYSKAALRVAADSAERNFPNVTYFPSYEIITSPAAQGRYYADDLRQVTDMGVKHVMRVFSKHFFSPGQVSSAPASMPFHIVAQDNPGIVCDEEVIEKSLHQN
ncbi:GSCFA domain-containing protein [Asticcacaulis excentricus]|uniref:GSCFA domain protein n=1 Tax=Asticcacaulis excentricus (strain ATCC 15261 / DSM 4724 / KCTC 12464 / NCIMB 9791 / VKM B-1370 / CB 48) TaxID=573065 RepID=E8RMP0_ASTEC|nr:GSCFA domain-containing protein [Asticcacaulis excentricus]ADU13921.1 GSCFA domain protein [Asticcacaulis excentricus CB 48]